MEALLNEATDPSDWKNDFTILRNLDESLRCDLCFDIYRSPVSIKSCHHTFCSTCIRTHINQAGNSGSFCPKCRQSKAYDSELVPQPVLETTAIEWLKAREFLAGLQVQHERDIAELQRRKTSQHASTSSLTASNGVADTDENGDPPRRSKRKKLDALPRQQGPAGSRSSPLTVDDEESETGTPLTEDDEDYTEAQSKDVDREIRPSDAVSCPICNHDFTMTALNHHLDTASCFPGCPSPTTEQRGFTKTGSAASLVTSKPKTGSSWFKSATSTVTPILANEKRVVRPQYNLKSDRELRRLLDDVGLPQTGDRDKLIERHRQWINLWNANLDSVKARKTAAQLRKELMSWEKHRTGAKDLSGLVERHKSSWVSSNKTQFDELIKTAKMGAERNKKLREDKVCPDREETEDITAHVRQDTTVDVSSPSAAT